jgi:hypothetical protein
VNAKNQSNRRSGRRRKPRKTTADPAEFWGASEALPSEKLNVRIASDPSAVVRSLGRPPLSGHHNAAEHYFAAVYERAVSLAGALAAAGDLIEPDELMHELD